ncbi:MAG TPA: SDR family oxidoreductase [Candidatus Deferrimicrobiaceae bacterium]
MTMKGKVAVVTGGSRGIGAAIARRLAAGGAAVAVNFARNRDAAETVVREIASAGGKAIAVQADVRDPEQVGAMAKVVAASLGPVDALVINASIDFPIVPFLSFRWEDFEKKLTGELKAAFVCCKAFVPGMVERKSGNVVAISSQLSRHPGEGFCAHSTAKSGLDAFMKSLALELGPSGVRVNVVAPGLTETDATAFMKAEAKAGAAMGTPLRRIGNPDDVAGAVLFMASDEARFVTGSYLPVSGGAQML